LTLRVRNGEQSVRSTLLAFVVPHAEREEYIMKVLVSDRSMVSAIAWNSGRLRFRLARLLFYFAYA
ncbi:MAG TPA: hypothetical protein DDY78_18765, partial [Planctomycetales bacterium]|nr:hypothetical protein [Planctomycetales bacterium]